MRYNSHLGLSDVISYTEKFCPVEIYYNGNLVWTDNCDASEWVPMEVAIQQFEQKMESNCRHIIIGQIKIEVVDFHHSIIRLKGKRIRRNNYET